MTSTAGTSGAPALSAASLWAFGLAVLAAAGILGVALGSGLDGIRWWIVALPAVVTAAPLVVRTQRVRVTATALLMLFAVITGASIGMLFAPAVLASLAAATTVGREP